MTNQELAAVLKKNPISVGCAVLTLLLAGGLYYISDDIPNATAELEQKSAEGQRLAANLQNSAQLNDQYAAIAAAGKELTGRLVHPGELAKNLQYFYKIEAETGTKLIELRQVPPAAIKGAKPNFIPVTYSVGLLGDYNQVLEYLRRLEHGTHFCRVITAGVSGATVERGPLKLSLTLELLGQP